MLTLLNEVYVEGATSDEVVDVNCFLLTIAAYSANALLHGSIVFTLRRHVERCHENHMVGVCQVTKTNVIHEYVESGERGDLHSCSLFIR